MCIVALLFAASAPGVPGEWVGEEHLLNVCMFESQLCIFCD
jgi:hypothetical protein